MAANLETCPQCGAELPPNSPGGLCPRCLVAMNLATETRAGGEAGPAGTQMVPPPRDEPLPVAEVARLFPQLEILECLGRGGMGTVYKARQPRLNRFAALKILSRGKGTDAAFAERFTREAQALARLNHSGIVAVYDFGEAGGHYYLLMEYVDGVNLRRLLAGRKLSPAESLAIVPQICEALQYAHSRGIVHRDIKPENILLDQQGRVKIADFGIAKMLGPEASAPPLTGAEEVIGTPHYMAPEQIEKPTEVDHRADIYSLGVVFYEMLTGELPLGKFAPPSRKVSVDVRLDEVVLHALEKEPEHRYQHASEVKTAVETIASTPAGADAPKPQTGSPAPRLSPLALAGAAWVAWFALACGLGYTPTGWSIMKAIRQTLGETIAGIFNVALQVPHMAAPFGVTVLGIIAVRQIRRSRGRLCGLRLALFDALFFPLLMLNAWLYWLGSKIADQTAAWRTVSDSDPASLPAWAIALAVLLGLALNLVIIRWIYRVSQKPPKWQPPAPEDSSALSGAETRGARPLREILKSIGKRLALVGVVDLILAETFNQVSVHWRESTQETWMMPMLSLSLAAVIWVVWPAFRQKRSRVRWAAVSVLLFFGLWALNLFYFGYLAPNLGLYQESDWVAELPGWQRQQRQGLAKRLWRRKLVPPQFGPVGEAPLAVDAEHPVRGIDLDSGKQAVRSSSETPTPPEWARNEGLDVMALMQEGRFTVFGLDLGAAPVPNNRWQTDRPQDVADFFLLERNQPKERIVLWPMEDYLHLERRQPRELNTNDTGTFYFRTHGGSLGILQIEEPAENAGGAKIRCKLVQTGTRPSAAAAPVTAGPKPAVELILYSVTAARPIRVLDLDRGGEIQLPPGLEQSTEEQFFHWLATQGVDLLGQSHRSSWTLTTSLRLAALERASGENMSLESLQATLETGKPGLAHDGAVFGYDQYRLPTNAALPLNFAFQTRQGGVGFLQITGFADNPPGVKIRYQLAKTVAHAPQAGEP